MELNKAIIRQWLKTSQEALAEGTAIADWHEGRISVYEFLLTFDLPEGA